MTSGPATFLITPLLIAESIAEQSPESLEIIAEYMAVADNLGSTEAHEWLRDYYSPDDIAEPYC